MDLRPLANAAAILKRERCTRDGSPDKSVVTFPDGVFKVVIPLMYGRSFQKCRHCHPGRKRERERDPIDDMTTPRACCIQKTSNRNYDDNHDDTFSQSSKCHHMRHHSRSVVTFVVNHGVVTLVVTYEFSVEITHAPFLKGIS